MPVDELHDTIITSAVTQQHTWTYWLSQPIHRY